jgi:hypothetical protein
MHRNGNANTNANRPTVHHSPCRYTLDTDPEFKLIDPTLTPKGEDEAAALRPRAKSLRPELMVVSPMRRATQTGLIAFEDAVAAVSAFNDCNFVCLFLSAPTHELLCYRCRCGECIE